MYLGKIVETAGADELFESPLHPYTAALLSAILIPDPAKRRTHVRLEGDVPSPVDIPKGCRFRARCPVSVGVCAEFDPELADSGGGHLVACHLRTKKPETNPSPR